MSGRDGEKPDYGARRQRIQSQDILMDSGMDVVLVLDSRDIFYLTGMHEGILAVALHGGCMTCFTSIVFAEEVRSRVVQSNVYLTSRGPRVRRDLMEVLVEWMGENKLVHAVVDTSKTTSIAMEKLIENAKSVDIEVEGVPDLISRIRAIKDEFELAMIEECVRIAETAFIELKNKGMDWFLDQTEKSVAWELEALMRHHGADRQGFPGTGIIVASGSCSAGVHPKPSDKRIEQDEVLLIDWGAEVDEYRSDSTRVLFPGSPPEWATLAFPVVKASHEASVNTLREGGMICDADLEARRVITEAGYDEFNYGVGHGVGLYIHESPWIRPESKDHFRKDMVTTIEPGIYLPGKGGIRLENIYHILDNDSRVLGDLSMNMDDMIIP